MTCRNGPNAAADRARTILSSESLSEVNAASRIGYVRATGEVLDEIERDARRLASRASRRVPSGERVALFVDDEESSREIGSVVLTDQGFHVELAADGMEAVEKAVALFPDVIVMDFEMPRMNGGEAVLRLASDERTRNIPVVMISAALDRVPREVRLGCAALLDKPCLLEELATLLHLIVAASSEADSSAALSNPSE